MMVDSLLVMREVRGLGPSLDRVDSEDHYRQETSSTIAGSSTLALKPMGGDNQSPKTNNTSGSTKWWLVTTKKFKMLIHTEHLCELRALILVKIMNSQVTISKSLFRGY